MSYLLATVQQRLTAIVAEGRGVDGSLGADAMARSIPAGTFRVTPGNGPIDDTNLPPERYDRAFFWRWDSAFDDPTNNNPIQTVLIEAYRVTLAVGYYTGLRADDLAKPITGTDSASTMVEQARYRALSDARRLKVALEYPDLYRSVSDDPSIVGVRRETSVISDRGNGRLVCETSLVVTIQSNNTLPYNP